MRFVTSRSEFEPGTTHRFASVDAPKVCTDGLLAGFGPEAKSDASLALLLAVPRVAQQNKKSGEPSRPNCTDLLCQASGKWSSVMPTAGGCTCKQSEAADSYGCTASLLGQGL